jgi:8-oxo-dGTP pyrophosphatase MutT (NUDIX family)
MLLRDGGAGLEVLLLKRHHRSDVHGGVHVFPGGKVDDSDVAQAFGFDDETGRSELRRRFGSPHIDREEAVAISFAAIRELAEECGIRLTGPADLYPHARWITPVGSDSPKRFDTWFFLARLPDGQSVQHDGHEAVESLWARPAEALRRFAQGQILLAPPQIMSLVALRPHESVRAAIEATSRTPPPRIQPEHVGTPGQREIALPGDPRHTINKSAFPGPTSLVHRNGRYEPAGGVDMLLS